MKQFSEIRLASFLNGPAGVDLDTGILYLNPSIWSSLGDNARKFVIAHELGHLNLNSKNEKSADSYALWKNMQMGEDSIAAIKGFYEAMPFVNQEQKARGEKLLNDVFENELSKGNSNVQPIISYFRTPDVANAIGDSWASDLAIAGSVIGTVIPGAGTVLGGVIGTGLGAGIDTLIANKKANEAEEKADKLTDAQIAAKEKEQQRLLELNRAKIEQQEQQELEALAAARKEAKKQQEKFKKTILIAGVILIVVGAIYLLRN